MSLGSKFLVWGFFLFGTMWLVNGAAIQGSSPMPLTTNHPPNMPPPMQRNSSDIPRNASAPKPTDSKFFISTEQTRREVPNPPPPPPPAQPFGINPNMLPQTPPPGFMMSPPPGFRQTQSAPQMMVLPPGMVMMQQPPPNVMNGPNQQGQSQRQEGLMANTTTIRVPVANASGPNNNTRRETEQTTTTVKPGSSATTRKPFTETPLGNDKQEPDGSNMKKPQAPPNPFVPPHPMPIPLPQFPFNPMMMNQPPLFIDSTGRLMMLVPVDPSFRFGSPLFPQGNPQQAMPQGPPIPGLAPMQIPLGQSAFGSGPIMPDFSKQPPSSLPRMGDKNKNTTSS